MASAKTALKVSAGKRIVRPSAEQAAARCRRCSWPQPAPGPSTDVTSIVEEIKSVMWDELDHSPRQWLNAIVATVLGVILVFNGKRVFEGLICVAVGLVAMFMAMNEITNLWGLGYDSFVRHLVGFEALLFAAFGAWKGMAGMHVFVGALLGFLVAMVLQSMLVHVGAGFMEAEHGSKWVLIIFYTLFVLIFVALLTTERHLRPLAVLSPALGGALVSSGLSYGVMALAIDGKLDFMKRVLPDLEPVNGTWIEFLNMLWAPHTAKDVGFFAGSKYNTMGPTFTLDRICGWSLWFILWVVGMIVQLRSWKKGRTAPARARELDEQLLGPGPGQAA